MKSFKVLLFALFATINISIFAMFLDPVLKNEKKISLFQEIEYQDNYNEHNENDFPVKMYITNVNCFFCSKPFGKKDHDVYCTYLNIAHTTCLKNELDKRIDTKNSWRFCPACDINYVSKENKNHLQFMPQFVQETIREKMTTEQLELEKKLKAGLPLKFLTTTMLTFGMIYSHKKLHWTIDFCNSFIFGLLDAQYGISSAQLHRSSNIKIKVLGKCLYILANKIIPAYTLYKSLNKKFLSDIVLSSVKINQPNKITKLNFKRPKELYSPYHDNPLLAHLIQEERNKNV